MLQLFQWGFCISFHLLNNGQKPPSQQVGCSYSNQKKYAGCDEHVCVCVCVKPTRIKVRYFKATCINAVNNVGKQAEARYKVKMWASEHFRAVVFYRETLILAVSQQEIYSMVRVIMNGIKISINGKQIRRRDSSATVALFCLIHRKI